MFLDANLRLKWFSPASEELIELLPSDIGRPIAHFAPKFEDGNLLDEARTVLEKLTPIEAEVRSKAGKWYLRRILPYRTQDNRIEGVVLAFVDITEHKREERVFAEAIVDTVRHPLIVLDASLRVVSANLAFYDLFQVVPSETEGRHIYELGNRQWNIPRLRTLLEEILPKNREFNEFEVNHEFDRIGRRNMLLNARRLTRRHARTEMILLAIEDITTRLHWQMMADELTHRVKNTLASVQALALQTASQSGSLEDFKTVFEGRLGALATAHDILIRDNWIGADIGTVAHGALDMHQLDDGRIAIAGSAVTLRPQAAVALAMILHELATNAAKYGALSVAKGKVAVTWRLEDGEGGPRVHLDWAESGGPPVAPPSRRGFGTKLIERSAAFDLAGDAKIDYRPAGVRCEISFPAAPDLGRDA
jgi:two-component system CheB/CheR fusion protein